MRRGFFDGDIHGCDENPTMHSGNSKTCDEHEIPWRPDHIFPTRVIMTEKEAEHVLVLRKETS